MSCMSGKIKYGTYELISDDSMCRLGVVNPYLSLILERFVERTRFMSQLLYPRLFFIVPAQLDGQAGGRKK